MWLNERFQLLVADCATGDWLFTNRDGEPMQAIKDKGSAPRVGEPRSPIQDHMTCVTRSPPAYWSAVFTTLPLLFGLLQFRQCFTEGPGLNVYSYFPGGAQRRAQFIGLPQQLKGSHIISLEVVRKGARAMIDESGSSSRAFNDSAKLHRNGPVARAKIPNIDGLSLSSC